MADEVKRMKLQVDITKFTNECAAKVYEMTKEHWKDAQQPVGFVLIMATPSDTGVITALTSNIKDQRGVELILRVMNTTPVHEFYFDPTKSGGGDEH